MELYPPQGKPTEKCALIESIVEFNTPLPSINDRFVRTESIVWINTP